MPVTIALETPLQDEVRELVAGLNSYLRPLSPVEFQFQMTVEQMAGADTKVFVARDAERRAVGMGSLRRHDARLGEVKRMFTVPEVRGQRVGAQLVQVIVSEARKDGMERLALETGATAGFEPAWRLYERSGFTECGAFLDYPDSGYSRFFEMMLVDKGVPA